MVRDEARANLPRLDDVIEDLRRLLSRLEPAYLGGTEAATLLSRFAEVERLGAAGRTLVARTVERSGAWRSGGHRSAAHWMAAATGVAVGQAVGTLETARRLERLPEVSEAFAAGELSEVKVREVALAASACPQAESELVAAARTETVPALRERCRRVTSSSVDPDAAHARIHAGRYLRHWTDTEGAFRLEARLTVDDGARVLAGMEPHRRSIFAAARRDGRREPGEAYAADALVALASGEACGPRATVQVRVDASALTRGHATRGEVCEIRGIGPIPVNAVRRLAADSILQAVVTRGADVTAVAHLGRTIPARLRTALEVRDPICVVPGCDVRHGLEIDHRDPFAKGGRTSLEILDRLCRWHHFLKTHRGYRLGGAPGAWTWSGPDPPPG